MSVDECLMDLYFVLNAEQALTEAVERQIAAVESEIEKRAPLSSTFDLLHTPLANGLNLEPQKLEEGLKATAEV